MHIRIRRQQLAELQNEVKKAAMHKSHMHMEDI